MTVKKANLCFNCLKPNHLSQQCNSRPCTKCNFKHNTLLHLETSINQFNLTTISNNSICSEEEVSPVNEDENSCSTSSSVTYSHCVQADRNTFMLLSTVTVIIEGIQQSYQCKALLDSAAQSNFISESLAQKLGIQREAVSINARSLNKTTTAIKHKVVASILSRVSNYKEELEFLVVPKITGVLPTNEIDTHKFQLPNNIMLADPTFYKPSKIDLLLGIETFYNVLKSGKIILSKQSSLRNTEFGWIVVGKFCSASTGSETQCHFNEIADANLNDQLKMFWRLESCNEASTLSPEEIKCETLFAKTYIRDDSGRFQVHLPFKDTVDTLGESKSIALRRFQQLERRLSCNPTLHSEYTAFINEYIELGHMQKICDWNNIKYILPHHAVLKPDSSTTKLRVVFDASAKTSTQISLNDVLMVGPSVQQPLTSIIMRFRKHRFAFTADIEKMYRQVNVNPAHTKYQCILWRESKTQPIEIFKLNTVTYGCSSAPYLATKVLQQLAIEEKERYPQGAKSLQNDTYVDDILSGHNKLHEAAKIQQQLIKIMSSAGMKLRKWVSNSKLLIEDIPQKDRELPTDSQFTIKTLGIIWNPTSDIFMFKCKLSPTLKVHTKRSVLSEIARLYDPLGLLSPITVKAKVFMQTLWCAQVKWDDPLSSEHSTFWHQFRSELPSISNIEVNRFILTESPQRIELHGFADASETAFGACIYIRCVDIRNFQCTLNLLCSKSRVAPLKKVTIPKLELCAAHLLSHLVKDVIDAMDIDFNRIVLWSDSTITLAWIKKASYTLKTFVANRVSEIQDLTATYEWRYVPTLQNPADIISRGTMPCELKNQRIWWHGPNFMYEEDKTWPKTIHCDQTLVPEQKTPSTLCNIIHSDTMEYYKKYSSLNMVIRVTAYMIRFIRNCKLTKNCRTIGTLTPDELNTGLMKIVSLVQSEEFPEELKSLRNNRQVRSNSKISNLVPFLDTSEISRVGGRLENSNLSNDQKHPILLPAKCHFTNLIFQSEHIKGLHAGPQLLLSLVRQRFWPINGNFRQKELFGNVYDVLR